MPFITPSNVITAQAQVDSSTIGTEQIIDADIATADLANDAVTSAKIKDGEIVNADISASAAIVDTKLAQIATASKVDGAALTGLANIPAGAGTIPTDNLPSLPTTHSNGIITRAASASSGAVTTAHGLSGTPTKVMLFFAQETGGELEFGVGQYDANGQSSWSVDATSGSEYFESSTTQAIQILQAAGVGQTGIVSVDGTNITITWTKEGTPNFGTATILWTAML